MKTLNLIIFLCMSLTIYSQQLITPPNANKKEVKILKEILKDYVDDENALVIYNPYAPLFIGFYGITYQYKKNICLFSLTSMLDDRETRMWVLLHEMGHVLDIFYGDLSEYPPLWKGERMDWDLEWADRPWEQNADRWAQRLWKNYFKSDPPMLQLYNEFGHHKGCLLNHSPTETE